VSLWFDKSTGCHLKSSSTDKYEETRRLWGGGIRGRKSTDLMRKRAKAAGQNISNPAVFSKL